MREDAPVITPESTAPYSSQAQTLQGGCGRRPLRGQDQPHPQVRHRPGRLHYMSQWRPCGCWEGVQEIWEMVGPRGVRRPRSLALVTPSPGPQAPLPALPAGRRGTFHCLDPLVGLSCCRSLSPHRVPAGSSVARGLSLRPVSMAVTAWSSLRAGSDGFLGPHRFCKNVFDRNYKATIGVDFEMERFEVAGIPFSLQM